MPVRSTYQAKRASVLTNPITNDSLFLSADNAAYSAFVTVPGDGGPGLSSLDGCQFRLRASGKVNVVTTSTLLAQFYYSANARTAITYNQTGVSALGNVITFASMTAPYKSNWSMDAILQWDYTSLILNGQGGGLGGPTPAILASAVFTQLTAVDLSLPGAGFMLGVHLGTGNATSTVTLSNFSLEVL